jgi:hypothetical protein
MRFHRFEKPMFRVAFLGERTETLSLIDFLRFVYTADVKSKLLNHPLGPSQVWQAWADETYIGFSTGRLMLRSGHRFSSAELEEQTSRLPWKRDRFDPAEQERTFRRFYPSFDVPPEHRQLIEAHPGAYWRSAEAFVLSGRESPARMLEIGAGNAVHVAFRHLINRSMRTVVVDLPESMFAGYLLLRCMDIDVALPHEEREASVTMRLPYQSIESGFDFAFNMSSFFRSASLNQV